MMLDHTHQLLLNGVALVLLMLQGRFYSCTDEAKHTPEECKSVPFMNMNDCHVNMLSCVMNVFPCLISEERLWSIRTGT